MSVIFTAEEGGKSIMSDHLLERKQLTLRDLQERTKAP